jgi:serine protease
MGDTRNRATSAIVSDRLSPEELMRSLRALTGLLLVIAANLAIAAPEYNPVRLHPAAEPETPIQRVIVKFRTSSTAGRVQAQAVGDPVATLATRSRLSLKETHPIASGLHVMHVEPQISGESLAATLANLRADPAVEYAEPDQRRYPHAVPDDTLFPNQWFLQSTQASGIDAVGAWDTTMGSSGVVIAELDTGVRFDHPDLRNSRANRLLSGYDFVSADPGGGFLTANDGDGRDPDPSDPGDWITTADTSNNAHFGSCTVANSSWHGTRVAGILGAITNNSMGVAGITWKNWILPVRVLGKCGGYDSDVIAGMLWAAGVHVDGVPDNPYPAKIINMSLGSTGTCPASYQTAIKQIVSLGVLIVVSAGNEGGPVDAPANCGGVAGIAAVRQIGTKVGFSSLGPEIALSAPGGNCVNTTAGQPCLFSIDTTINTGTQGPGTNTYTDQTNFNVGTSFSAPIVAGIAGLMVAVNGNLNAAQLIARLQEGATRPFPVSSDATIPKCHVPASATDTQVTECSCTTQACGAGMANAKGAVQAALRPIAAVALPANVAPGINVTLNGAASAAACNHTISSYAWTVVSPTTNPPAIQNANMTAATVVAPVAPSTYTLRLTVTDEAGRQDTADVVLASTEATTVAPASAGTNACPAAIAFAVSSNAVSGNSGGGGGGGAMDLLTLFAGAIACVTAGARRRRATTSGLAGNDREQCGPARAIRARLFATPRGALVPAGAVRSERLLRLRDTKARARGIPRELSARCLPPPAHAHRAGDPPAT